LLRPRSCTFPLAAITLLVGASGHAQPDNGAASGDKRILIQRIDSAPVIDGVLDDGIWATIAPSEDLHQVNPVEYADPSERTEIRLAYDDEALYVSARMWDSEPDRITAQVLRQGEGLSNEDRFALIIDPHLDRRSGYRFQINPNGVRWDALYSDTSNVESNWEGIWQGAATRDDQGWSAEIAIPFKTLSFDPDSDTWGVNFERTIQRNDETLAWVSRNRQLNPGISGTLVGFHDLQQGRGLDIVPSVSAKSQRTFGTLGDTSTELDPSLDVFYKITPSLNGSLTLNTDFSATEIDDRQVNLTRFSLFFPEKRDFFLQDADIFEFGRIAGGGNNNNGGGGGGGGGRSGGGGGGGSNQNGMPFFSRRIGLSPTGQPLDITAGAKISGRVNRLNVGALAVRQDGFGTVDESDLLVGRLSANVLGESNVGVIITDGDPWSNLASTTVGTDFNYRNTRLPGGKVLEANAWAQKSENEGVPDNDQAYGFSVGSPNSTGWRGEVEGRQIEENFAPALGFVNETGIRSLSGNVNYRFRFADRRLRTVNVGVSNSQTERLDTGDLDREQTEIGFNLDTASQDRLFVNFTENKENLTEDFQIYTPSDGSAPVVVPAGSYQWRSAFVGLRSGNQRKVAAFVGIGKGDYYDGRSQNINTNVEWRPSRKLRLVGSYQWRDVNLVDGDFQVRQSSFTAQYVFSSKLSWINLIQYDNFSEIVGFNSRLHWIPEPGREGFIVINHNIEDRDKDGTFRSLSADIALKFSYTWRF
jgi:hypothetical protein